MPVKSKFILGGGGGCDKVFLQASFQKPVGDVRNGAVLRVLRKVFYTPNLQTSTHDFHVDKGQTSL